MTLSYTLLENKLTENPDDCWAVARSAGTITKEGIVDHILKRGTLTTRTDALAVTNIFEEVVTDLVTQGYNITTPLFNISYSFAGVYTRQKSTR